MGKTSIWLAAFLILKEKGYVEHGLIVTPIRPMYGTWPQEILKWEEFNGLTHHIMHGEGKRTDVPSVDLYIVNPDATDWVFGRSAYKKYNKKTKLEEKIPENKGILHFLPPIDMLCVDESTKYKNSGSVRFKSIKRKLHKFDRRCIMTGSPSPNGSEDLFAQVYLVDRGAALGTFITHFRKRFMYPDDSGYGWVMRRDAAQEIADCIAPLVMDLSAADHLDLPEYVPVTIPITLPPDAMRQYKLVEKEFFAEIDGGKVEAANTAVAGGKCRQICNGAVYDHDRKVLRVHDEKLDAMEALIDELNGNPLLLVYEFKHDLERIEQRLGKLPNVTGVNPKALVRLQERFNANEIPVLALHAGSAHGLNIQEGGCRHMLWFCTTWNLEHFIQVRDRLVRQGNCAMVVMCYFLVAVYLDKKGKVCDTIDGRVVKVLANKETDQLDMRSLIREYRS